MSFLMNNWLGFFIASLLVLILAIGCVIYGMVNDDDKFMLAAFGLFTSEIFFAPMAIIAVLARFTQFIVHKS